jgi:hypothetical protein
MQVVVKINQANPTKKLGKEKQPIFARRSGKEVVKCVKNHVEAGVPHTVLITQQLKTEGDVILVN